ncbi:MarR family winged helix-turn-helix transcriptional regulator [Heyndrickxia coagulans]|uniref:Helix-turn-helix domain-containing protein n=1 Tax=Heyndrickxia coagulans TaxID=1398 RepID=A0AAW7CAP5_HEYCO|nr:helix-turn-helix domain-containing protein [Heyndrickxia coagulans]MDL5040022.1 helix-turn-helix domain-containing protein [Heyndrickxia coagulans]
MRERAEFIRDSIDFLQRYIIKSLQREAEEFGLTVPQVRVLAEVLTGKKVSIKLLSRNLKMTQSTVSEIVERLTLKGLLVKTPSASDKRSVEISPSSELEGELSENISRIINQSFVEALNLLEPDEQDIVEQGLRLLVNAVKKKIERDGLHKYESFDVFFFRDKNESSKLMKKENDK